MTDYRCVNGHDKCGEMYTGPECPYCEHTNDTIAAPMGAIENGREHFRRLVDFYSFTCEAGHLGDCGDYQEAVRCFEHLVDHIVALEARAERAEAKAVAAEERGLVFNMLPDGRLDFCAIREGSRLWDGRVRAEAAEKRAEALTAEVARLREAAEPFARHAKFYAYDPEEEIFCAIVLVGSTGEKHRLTVGDLRRLAQALDATPTAPESRERELDKRRLDGLRELCGYVEDGSETSVNISQDDATRDWIIRAGKRWWHGKSLRAALDAALARQQ